MRFADFLCVDAMRVQLHATDKEGVIRELVDALAEAGEIDREDQDSIVKAIFRREELGTTAIGPGIAIPHVKHPGVERIVGTVGVARHGIDFNSLDGAVTEIFFLLISPPDKPGEHLRALEKTSRHLQDITFCQSIKQANTATEIQDVLGKADHRQLMTQI